MSEPQNVESQGINPEQQLKETICEVGRLLFTRGMVASNDGNISCRTPDGNILVTPTGVSKGAMTPDMILKVDLEGNVLAKTKNGMTFETSQINYDSEKKRFTTKEKIRLTDAALTVEGTGMDLSVNSQQAIVKSQVEATVYPGKRIK